MGNSFDAESYEQILHDRTELTDFEKNQLIPELKSRLKILKKYYSEIIHLCDIQKEQSSFNANLHTIINPKGMPSFVNNSPQSLSEKFFSDVKLHAQQQGVDDIDSILTKYEEISDTKQLSLFVNEVNLLCSSLLAVKNKLFLYKIDGYPIVTNQNTGQIITIEPPQYYLTTEPFQIIIDNIIAVAKATSETLHEWHKYTMKLKSQYLDLYANRLTIKNSKIVLYIQIITVFLAVSLSAFFLLASDPFGQLKENLELKTEITQLKEENNQLKLKQKTSNQSLLLTERGSGGHFVESPLGAGK